MSMVLSREGQLAVALWDRLLLVDVDAPPPDAPEQKYGTGVSSGHSDYNRNHHGSSQGSMRGSFDQSAHPQPHPHPHPNPHHNHNHRLHEQSRDRDEDYHHEDEEEEEDNSPTSVMDTPSEGHDTVAGGSRPWNSNNYHNKNDTSNLKRVCVSTVSSGVGRQPLSSCVGRLYVRACLDIVVGQRARYTVVFGSTAMRVWRVMNLPALISFQDSMLPAQAQAQAQGPGLALAPVLSQQGQGLVAPSNNPHSHAHTHTHSHSHSHSPSPAASGPPGTTTRSASSLFPRIAPTGTGNGSGTGTGSTSGMVRPLAPRHALHPHTSPGPGASLRPSPRPPSITAPTAWETHTQPAPLSMARHR